MVNLNIEIPDDLHKKIKLSAVREDKTLKECVTQRLDRGLREMGR